MLALLRVWSRSFSTAAPQQRGTVLYSKRQSLYRYHIERFALAAGPGSTPTSHPRADSHHCPHILAEVKLVVVLEKNYYSNTKHTLSPPQGT